MPLFTVSTLPVHTLVFSPFMQLAYGGIIKGVKSKRSWEPEWMWYTPLKIEKKSDGTFSGIELVNSLEELTRQRLSEIFYYHAVVSSLPWGNCWTGLLEILQANCLWRFSKLKKKFWDFYVYWSESGRICSTLSYPICTHLVQPCMISVTCSTNSTFSWLPKVFTKPEL